MTEMKNIMVAFDGSKNAIKALKVAKKITIGNQAQLTVLYVHDDPFENPVKISTTQTGDEYMYLETDFSLNDEAIMSTEEDIVLVKEIPYRVISLAKETLKNTDNIIYKRLSGKPAEEIVKYANEDNSDVIIIGNRGINILEKLVTGSVSSKVSKHSTCSVFIIK